MCPSQGMLNVFSGVCVRVTPLVTSCFSQYDTFREPDCQILAVTATSGFASNCCFKPLLDAATPVLGTLASGLLAPAEISVAEYAEEKSAEKPADCKSPDQGLRLGIGTFQFFGDGDSDRGLGSMSTGLFSALTASQWLEPRLRSEWVNRASLSQVGPPFSRGPGTLRLRFPAALAHSQTPRSASDASANWRWKLWPAPWPTESPVKSKKTALQN
jgi:hypothetical protein